MDEQFWTMRWSPQLAPELTMIPSESVFARPLGVRPRLAVPKDGLSRVDEELLKFSFLGEVAPEDHRPEPEQGPRLAGLPSRKGRRSRKRAAG